MIGDGGIDKDTRTLGSPVQKMVLERRFFSSSMGWVRRHIPEVGRWVGESLGNHDVMMSIFLSEKEEKGRHCNTLLSGLVSY